MTGPPAPGRTHLHTCPDGSRIETELRHDTDCASCVLFGGGTLERLLANPTSPTVSAGDRDGTHGATSRRVRPRPPSSRPDGPRTTPRTSPGTCRVELTAAQARMVNSALAREEAEEHDDPTFRPDVLERTRAKVHRAMERAGIEP